MHIAAFSLKLSKEESGTHAVITVVGIVVVNIAIRVDIAHIITVVVGIRGAKPHSIIPFLIIISFPVAFNKANQKAPDFIYSSGYSIQLFSCNTPAPFC